ncbi:MAG: YlxR family protein [Clostridia bacterium]|nr:YlxR family protein [Clostridia bacterium]
MKKIPLRRCLGCFESKPKNELYRIVKTKENSIVLDKTGKLNGRGAYICKSKECLEKAIKSKKIEREFEAKISDEIYTELKNMIEID